MEFRTGEEENKLKLKLIGAATGMLVGFYLFFRYILPLVWPFLLSVLLALLFYPVVNFMHRFFKINKMAGTILLLSVLTIAIGAAAAVLVNKIAAQVMLFADNFSYYRKNIETLLGGACTNVETLLHLKEGYAFNFLNDGLNDMIKKIQPKVMQFLIGTSLPMVKSIMDIIIVAAFVLVAFFLIMKDMEEIRKAARKSVFHKELSFIYQRGKVVFGAYIKTQLIIMVIVAACSVLGLTLVKNKYAWVIGISVGVMDALPLLGSGMILVPMTIVFMIQKNFMFAAIIFTTFIACYFAREYLEPKLMGEKMGVNPIITLLGIYVGYELFGFLGMFAGALSVIFICDIIKVLQQNH